MGSLQKIKSYQDPQFGIMRLEMPCSVSMKRDVTLGACEQRSLKKPQIAKMVQTKPQLPIHSGQPSPSGSSMPCSHPHDNLVQIDSLNSDEINQSEISVTDQFNSMEINTRIGAKKSSL